MQSWLAKLVFYSRTGLEILAMVVIVAGIVSATVLYLWNRLIRHQPRVAFYRSRSELGHTLSMGLGILIGASVLKTIVAPGWMEIGQVAAVIAIRAVVNVMLWMDIHQRFEDENQPAVSLNPFKKRQPPNSSH